MNISGLSAYARAATVGSEQGLGARETGGPSFGEVFAKVGKQIAQLQHNAETQSIQGAMGKADLTDVVNAVSNAEVALQSLVAIRDRVVNAYQEIMRMPI